MGRSTSTASLRAHNWGFLFYEEDLPKLENGWDTLVGTIRGLNVRAALSPWHNEDTFDEEDVADWVERHLGSDGKLSKEDEERKPNVGDVEKSHVHGMLCFKGNKSYKQIIDMLSPLGIRYVKKIEDKSRNLRYFAHLDHPNKHPYNKEDVITFGGLDRSPLYEISKGEQYEVLTDLLRTVKEEQIFEFCDLCDWTLEQPERESFEVLVEKATFVNLYMQSKQRQKTNMLAKMRYDVMP